MLNGGGGIAQTILTLCLSILSFRLFGYFWSRKMSLIVEMKALSTCPGSSCPSYLLNQGIQFSRLKKLLVIYEHNKHFIIVSSIR